MKAGTLFFKHKKQFIIHMVAHYSRGKNSAQYANITTILKKTVMLPYNVRNRYEQCHIAGDSEPRLLPVEYRYPTNICRNKKTDELLYESYCNC